MSTPTPLPVSDSKPVLVLGAIATGGTALLTTLAVVSGVPAWLVIVVGALVSVSTAVGGYLAQKTTAPWKNVDRLYVDQTGQTVAGPASPLPTGTVVADVGGPTQASGDLR